MTRGQEGDVTTAARVRKDGWVLVVRATAKLLNLVGPPTVPAGGRGTTLLGPWYATVLFWRPRVVLLVSEATLLPVLMPAAPAATLASRIAVQVATVLAAHQAPPAIIAEELLRMRDARFGTTANRSVVGVMTEFVRLATVYREDQPELDLLDLSMRLATTPCGPLYRRNISPDRELAAVLRSVSI